MMPSRQRSNQRSTWPIMCKRPCSAASWPISFSSSFCMLSYRRDWTSFSVSNRTFCQYGKQSTRTQNSSTRNLPWTRWTLCSIGFSITHINITSSRKWKNMCASNPPCVRRPSTRRPVSGKRPAKYSRSVTAQLRTSIKQNFKRVGLLTTWLKRRRTICVSTIQTAR